jgi:hypothetical protein
MLGRVKLLASVIGLLVPVMFTAKMVSADETFTATKAITLPGGQKITSFDIGFVDPRIGNYFLADRTNKSIDIIDTSTNTVAAQYQDNFAGATGNNNTSGPDGVLVTDHNRIWVGDGGSQVKVLDLGTGKELANINTGGKNRADELCFDAKNRIIVMANDAESPFPFISFIDADSYKVLGKMTMDGTNGTPKATNGIEQCQWSPRTHRVYLNIPEVNGPGDDSVPGAVLVINAREQEIEQTFTIPLASCAGPQGMAIGPHGQILLGCNAPGPSGNSPTAVINERTGEVVATLNQESGSDEVDYNPADNQYFLARSGVPNTGVPQFLGVVDAGPPAREDASVSTSPGGTGAGGNHSVAADPVTGHVYVPIGSTSKSTVCSSVGGSDAQGCIAVFTTPNDDCFAQGMPVRDFDEDGNARFEHEGCRDHDRHEARND